MENKIKKVLILGSGALKIGEAGEFDYSGSQALKALKEENIETILVNPNIATIQTSKHLASKVYFLPVTVSFVEKIIKKEKPDGILLGFGGQTALNCGLELSKKGILKKYNVDVLGTPVSSIEKTEDRLLFRKTIEELGLKVPKSVTAKTIEEVKEYAENLTLPAMVRSGFSLGGLGSGVVRTKEELINLSQKALAVAPQILIEEYLEGWKEMEYEVVRDNEDNTIVICNMENLDPMGIHTGESIVVAPSQTLSNSEYHGLREIAIKVIKSLPIVGECNIQYALNPKNGDYRIIEVNARLSRSSALASKATGYPLAYVAAKIALGYPLYKIKNQVTKKTSAFFEPALDYIVVKIPRWDFVKFKDREMKLGSEMQSVGEVMAIGRSFEEALQKAIRSLDVGYEGIISDDLEKEKIIEKQSVLRTLKPTPERLFNIASNLFYGQSVDKIVNETGITRWFIERIKTIVDTYKTLLDTDAREITKELLEEAKKSGFSDPQLGKIFGISDKDIRNLRKKWGIVPKICRIDTLAGEFPAETNYLYLSYHRKNDDEVSQEKQKVIVLGGGPYQIGSSVEFDWCAVTAAMTAKKLGYAPIMVNCNPETVSTDYDISSKLYFEELTLERVLDIYDKENCPFIVSVGGQIPNSLAFKLAKLKIPLLGTDPKYIDQAEDREKFSNLLDKQNISQPEWARVKTKTEAIKFCEKVKFPVLVRPSYVLSGKAMSVLYSHSQFEDFLKDSQTLINSDYPVVISKFVEGAREVDFDGVAKDGKIVLWALSQHVENAGVHSGDATLVLPSYSLSKEATNRIKEYSEKIIKELHVSGPINIQYLVKENGVVDVKVIEANLRASRSFPFVSKVLDVNFIEYATQILLGQKIKEVKVKKPDFFAIKAPYFSFTRLRRVDPVLKVEMSSTGEVASFGNSIEEAYLKANVSAGTVIPHKAVLLSLGGTDGKERLLKGAKMLDKLGFTIYATKHTLQFLEKQGIKVRVAYKLKEGKSPTVIDLIKGKHIDLVINIIDKEDLGTKELMLQETDGFLIRRAAVDTNIPLFTKPSIATLFIESLAKNNESFLQIKSWDEYIKH